MGFLLESERVLHPVGIITVGIILAGVSSTGFFAVSGSNCGLGTIKY